MGNLKSNLIARSFWAFAFVLFLMASGFVPASAADKAKKADEQASKATEQTKKADESTKKADEKAAEPAKKADEKAAEPTKKAADNAAEAANKVVFHVDQNDKAVMNLTLNNVQNMLKYFKEKGGKVTIEVVTYGPGVNMLRKDKSPVTKRITALAKDSEVQFSACNNTIAKMTKKAKGKKPPLVAEATPVPSGVVRLLQLQQQGYAYIRP